MPRVLFATLVLLGLSVQAGVAIAQQTRPVKFESRYGKRVQGAVCLLETNGETLEITTPSRIDLPLNENKELFIDSLKCEFRGVNRSTVIFPDHDNSGAKIYGVSVDFKSTNAEFRFKKQNGGVAFYSRGNRLTAVSVPER